MISDIGKSCTFDFIEHRYGTWPAVWWPSTKRKCHLQFCFYHHFGKRVETIPQYKESGIFTWIFQESLDTPPPHSPPLYSSAHCKSLLVQSLDSTVLTVTWQFCFVLKFWHISASLIFCLSTESFIQFKEMYNHL